MSRMIFAFFSIAFLSGCQCCSAPRYFSIATARLETLGPQWSLSCPTSGGCDNCTPHRPFTHNYFPCWDDKITMHTAHLCAFRDFGTYRSECGCFLSHHFKMGFITAYEDLAMNRKPRPRIVPPPKYWNAFYRSCAGQPDVDDWFAGYDAGLEAGANSGVSRFHEITLNRNGCNGGWTNSGGYIQSEPTAASVQPVPASNGPGTPNPYGLPYQ